MNIAHWSIAYRLAVVTLLLFANTGFADAADPARGAKVFQQCAACHSVKPGEHLTGPSLADVWGRKAGTAPEFRRYSEALQRSGVVWDGKTLDQWLASPARFIPGNTMTFDGIKDAGQRQDVIAYLHAVSEGKAPPMAPSGRGGMMGGAAPADLKTADTESVVTSLTHCGDTYTLKTASGETHKIWEFNLRIKTDSSARGPERGKPVITGAGMRGDRANIVFATPDEISGFIKSCM
jgi:cytochrome c